jgi:hypothetical protein
VTAEGSCAIVDISTSCCRPILARAASRGIGESADDALRKLRNGSAGGA